MSIVPIEEVELLHANICHALADPKRIQILYALHDGPKNVSALVELLATPQSTISRHLAVLRQRALVSTEREGVSVTYSIANEKIIVALDTLRDLLRDVVEAQSTVLDQ